MNLGLLAGYLAIGAPPVPATDALRETANYGPQHLLAACRDDEHDLKLAYSCWQQATHWQNSDYVNAAMAYLA